MKPVNWLLESERYVCLGDGVVDTVNFSCYHNLAGGNVKRREYQHKVS